jgi:hypothetical protein
MSSRALSDHEVFDFLSQHQDIAAKVQQHEQLFLNEGHPFTWDQTVIAAQGDTTYAVAVPIPPRGLSVKDDPSYGDVIVFPDAAGVLHFISTDNRSLVEEIQKPVFESDPDYWELFDEIAKKFKESIPTLPQLEIGAGVVVFFVILVLALK